MFPDVELISSVRSELDIVVEEGVAKVVQLLRNSESGSTSGAARATEDAFEMKNRKIRQYKRWVHEKKSLQESEGQGASLGSAESGAEGEVGGEDMSQVGGKLTQQLVSQGLLTNGMMSQLKREWMERETTRGRRDTKGSPKTRPKK